MPLATNGVTGGASAGPMGTTVGVPSENDAMTAMIPLMVAENS